MPGFPGTCDLDASVFTVDAAFAEKKSCLEAAVVIELALGTEGTSLSVGLSVLELPGINDLFLFTVQGSLAVVEVVFQ